MSTRRALPLALCTVLAACGSGGSSSTSTATSNAATSRAFTYGATQPYSGSSLSTASGLLASLGTLAQDASGGMLQPLTNVKLAETVLGSSVAAVTAPADRTALRRALAAARPAIGTTGFDPNCEVVTATAITFTCKYTDSSSSTTETLDGSFLVANQQRPTWSFTATRSVTSSSGTESLTITEKGDVTATSTAITGTELTSFAFKETAGGTTYAAAVDESLAIDVTLARSCATGIVGGTLEVHRVWTTRPTNASASDEPDKAAKVTWTGCGAATIQYGS